MDFADALKKAQELGFAEADPTADVEGLDAGRKVAIMASIAFHPELYSLMYIQKELRRLRQGILHMQRNLTASSSFWVLHIIQKMESRSESIR